MRICLVLLMLLFVAQAALAVPYKAGVGVVDITPDFPVRLSGYLSRKTEATEVQQHLFAKALALKAERGATALLITVDNCGIPRYMTDEVAARLRASHGILPERIAINASHTHSAPALTNVIPNLFGRPIPPEHQANIDRYTGFLTDAIYEAARLALEDLQPATLHFGIGTAGFATNRRTQGGPVDHDLPVLCVKGLDGTPRTIVAGYACHCTTLSGAPLNGDWAGYAQEALQDRYPGAVGMIAVGCGGDQNPMPRGTVAHAQTYGAAIADGVQPVIDSGLRPITAPLDAVANPITLAFDTLPTRAELEERAKELTPKGYHARVQLAKLDRGQALATEIPYVVQAWNFGDELAMVFLPGEVVVDYALRFKGTYDRKRMWVCAYTNDAPCYIPSARILAEGGYEGGEAMIYYDQPTRFAGDVEDRIVAAVEAVVPSWFRGPGK